MSLLTEPTEDATEEEWDAYFQAVAVEKGIEFPAVRYHVFRTGEDEWINDYDDAKALFDQWCAESEDVRLYEESYETPRDYFETMECEESCIDHQGDFPY